MWKCNNAKTIKTVTTLTPILTLLIDVFSMLCVVIFTFYDCPWGKKCLKKLSEGVNHVGDRSRYLIRRAVVKCGMQNISNFLIVYFDVCCFYCFYSALCNKDEWMNGCGMGTGLWLELGSGVRVGVMARAPGFGVRISILFCSSVAQFLAILRIRHCTDAERVWR